VSHVRLAPFALLLGMAGPCLGQGSQVNPSRPFHGWLTDRTEPTFWTWRQPGVSSPEYGQYMTPWIHLQPGSTSPEWYTISSGVYSINTAVVQSAANQIAQQWVNLGRPTDYALFIQNWGEKSALFKHADDLLTPPPGYSFWNDEYAYEATPWRAGGVQFSAEVLDELISKLSAVTDPEDPNSIIAIPPPTRFFFDEEYWRHPSCNGHFMLQYLSVIGSSPSALQLQPLFGDHSLITSASSPTVADAYGTTMWTWMQSLNWPSGPNYDILGCDKWDRLFFWKRFDQVHYATIDGAFAAMFQLGTANHPTWADVTISNYRSSAWHNENYPSISRYGQGARGPYTGWHAMSMLGSTGAQSPVLYPVSEYHRDVDTDLQDTSTSPPVPLEAEYTDASLRLARMRLDHAIFTLGDQDTTAPSLIIPWLCRPVYAGEEYARDVMALVKAKGIREAIWWGNESGSSAFNKTWKVTDGVWNLNLTEVRAIRHDGGSNTTYTGTDLNPFLFSEEYAAPVTPSKRNNMPAFPAWYRDPAASGYYADLTAQFTLSPSEVDGPQEIYTYPQRLKFIIEVIDGGGAWDKGPWSFGDFDKLEITKFRDGNAPLVSSVSISDIPGATIKELYSTSTRRASFTSDPNLPHGIGPVVYTFDQMGAGSVNPVTNVIDRKTILEITIPLDFEIGSDSFSPTDFVDETNHWFEINFALYHTHDLSGFLDAVLPYRVDLLQLYDATPTSLTPITESFRVAQGDINNDGVVDAMDVMEFVSMLASGIDTAMLDVDGDGDGDTEDLAVLINLVTEQNAAERK
jgi:hypothetical protein